VPAGPRRGRGRGRRTAGTEGEGRTRPRLQAPVGLDRRRRRPATRRADGRPGARAPAVDGGARPCPHERPAGARRGLPPGGGPQGAGKARLPRECLARAGDEVWSLRGRCLSYGDGITFWPLAEVARAAAGIGDDDPRGVANSKLRAVAGDDEVAERVGAAIGLIDTSFRIEETFWAARRLLERLASQKPLIVLIDDIHWAEGTFLDMLRFVLDSAEAPLV